MASRLEAIATWTGLYTPTPFPPFGPQHRISTPSGTSPVRPRSLQTPSGAPDMKISSSNKDVHVLGEGGEKRGQKRACDWSVNLSEGHSEVFPTHCLFYLELELWCLVGWKVGFRMLPRFRFCYVRGSWVWVMSWMGRDFRWLELFLAVNAVAGNRCVCCSYTTGGRKSILQQT